MFWIVMGPVMVSVNTRFLAGPSPAVIEVTNVTLRPAWTPFRGRLLSSLLRAPNGSKRSCAGGVSLNAWRWPPIRP